MWATLTLVAQHVADSLGLPPSHSVRSTTLLGAGRTHLYDAYLSPLDYVGTSASVLQLSERTTRWGKGRVSQLRLASLHATMASNATETALFYDLEGELALGYHYNLHPTTGLRLGFGPLLGAHVGGTYAPRNGNNPGQARMALDLALSLRLDYRFALWRRSWLWASQLDAPVVGAMFQPQFGQSYYELFGLGHRHHNVVMTTPFNAPSLRFVSTLSLPFWKGRLSLGVQSNIRQSLLHNLGRHAWQHHLVVGYTRTLKYLD